MRDFGRAFGVEPMHRTLQRTVGIGDALVLSRIARSATAGLYLTPLQAHLGVQGRLPALDIRPNQEKDHVHCHESVPSEKGL